MTSRLYQKSILRRCYFMPLIIAGVIWGVIWGYATKAVIMNKGYDEDTAGVWWLWGFLFGIIGFFVAFSKPQAERPINQQIMISTKPAVDSDSDILKKGGWKCSCGKVNYSYATTCSSCRKTKEQAEDEIYQREQEEQAKKAKEQEMENLKYLSEYKQLFDNGIISQEEFDKKKQLIMNGGFLYDNQRKELENLKKLVQYKHLLETGIITQEDFEMKKQEILSENESVKNANKTSPNKNSERYRTCPVCGKNNLKSRKICSQCKHEFE